MENKIRIAVVGAGIMGNNHARTINKLESTELSMIVDSDLSRAERVAAQFDCSYADNVDVINQDTTDGVVVAAPSNLHAELTEALLTKNLDVLVEKPISLNVDDAERINDTATKLGKILMVGHIELFNPVVRELRKVIGGLAIRSMRFDRLGFVADTSRLNHDAILDLMVHDIAIALSLTNADENNITVLSSTGREDTPFAPDPVNATLAIQDNNGSGGIDVHLRSSRAYTGGKVRAIQIETDSSVIEADLLTRVITQKVAGEGRFNIGDGVFTQDIKTAFCTPQSNEEPLKLEIQYFADCILGRFRPENESVSAKDGIAVLSIANKILEKCVIVK